MKTGILVKLFIFAAVLSVALSGCGALAKPTPAALPTIVLDGGAATTPSGESQPAGGSVTASGNITPAQQAQIAAAMSGTVQEVKAAVGDTVKAGQVLVKLAGSEKMSAAVDAANLELLSAQQALADLKTNAEQDRAQAQLRLAKAKDALDQAMKRRGWKEYRVGNDNQIAVARADLIVAQDHVKKTEEVYGGYADNPEDNLNKAAALSAVSAARTARDRAQANLNYLLSLPDSLEVGKADAELEVARTEQDAAQREYDQLKNGPDPSKLALAEARVKNAQAQLAANQSALVDLEMKAPFDGTVSKVNITSGEWVIPGQVAVVLTDLNHLRVETTDLSELNITQVKVGQPVAVQIKALNQIVKGKVTQISPLSDTLGGDVVYKTTIDLDKVLEGLRAGMSVEVIFETNP